MEQSVTKNSAGSIILISCLLGFGYAILRYQIAGPVPWKDLPFFIFNKGASLSAWILLSLNFGLGPLKRLGVGVPQSWLAARRALGMTGFLLILFHVFISFMLFKPEIFGKFFEEDGSLTLLAGLSMLGGVIAFVILWAYNLSFQTHMREDKAFIQFITSRRFLLVAMLFSAIHVFFMGYQGWLRPEDWHGGLPPISLVAFVIWATMYVINILGRK